MKISPHLGHIMKIKNNPNGKSWLIEKDPDSGKYWRQEEKGTTEDEMVGWHHRLNGHEFEWTLGVGDGQGGLVCCSPWGHSQTRLSNWTELNTILSVDSFGFLLSCTYTPPASCAGLLLSLNKSCLSSKFTAPRAAMVTNNVICGVQTNVPYQDGAYY